jgi:hypothetical protein
VRVGLGTSVKTLLLRLFRDAATVIFPSRSEETLECFRKIMGLTNTFPSALRRSCSSALGEIELAQARRHHAARARLL